MTVTKHVEIASSKQPFDILQTHYNVIGPGMLFFTHNAVWKPSKLYAEISCGNTQSSRQENMVPTS